ncbi:helix-turn-helix domain-containing protein [Streptomyces paludis]|uniref:XRE family transcriptional regulator n=1 Tax=Streptomyces paludis TaxID=2282738 RepID=A0A345HT48_9ACTN|nr:helix-turn-helix transcriptional regulator [Streptomyces paludis]AXG79872.1 XRE family transcriptional regulator [Streptomyces paludis]
MGSAPGWTGGGRVSTVLGRKLGGELYKLRVAAGKKQQEASDALSATPTKVVKMESGSVPMRDPDVKALCELYEADAEVVRQLRELARRDRERRKVKGWWDDELTPAKQVEYISTEDAALSVRQWQMAIIPGLFQTPEYLRAMGVADLSCDDLDRIEDVVATRLKRQARLHGDEPLKIHAVIWEAALRQLMGGPEVMRGQLSHLCELTKLPNVQIQVLPFRAGAHPCIGGPFSILSFAEEGAVDVVYQDTARSTIWYEDPAEGADYAALFARVAGASLSPYDSVQFIDSVSKGLNE